VVRIAGVDVPDRKRVHVALRSIYGIGPKIASSIASYFQVDANKSVIEKLRVAGVNMKQEPRPISTDAQPFSGKTFVVTGTLSAFSRMQQVLRMMTSASASDVAGTIPSASSRPAMRSLSCSFIWHP